MNEAELLFTRLLNCDRQYLYLNRDLVLGEETSCAASSALRERIKARPIQYILGKADFMGLEFRVNPDVLIPRPETEILVETAIKKSTEYGVQSTEVNILDIGTGSGCIAVSLAKFLDKVKITATDISAKALKVARENAVLNDVSEKIDFIKSDIFPPYLLHSACPPAGRAAYEIIVSNPPYVVSSDIDKLQPEIQYEPRIALEAGKDGLGFYRRIISESHNYLKKEGLLILEMGFRQAKAIKEILHKRGKFEVLEIIKDYSDIDRVVVARLISENEE
ncbi:MAG: peptide chain release factor N(5)-glutamine methyltransferase [Candidatus Omnitrophota bacterium]|nr:MAG: peptide chain release factor N(5)-glutamine methyltransferase [Candidatus Omnitrophota bacterium]